jgi:8-oxo-dGTP pyrophosphatase MutT (NUDIX family)
MAEISSVKSVSRERINVIYGKSNVFKELETINLLIGETMNYRQGISAFIINDKKEFILVCGVSDRTYWKIPAGGIEGNETQEEGLYREMNEELGLEKSDFAIITKSKFVDRFNWPKDLCEEKFKKNGYWLDGQERAIFICQLTNPSFKLKLQKEEVSDAKWFNKENYEKFISIPNQLETMKKVIEEFKEYF